MPDIDTDPYPEHTRLHAVVDKSQAIGEFIEWLSGQGYVIAERGTSAADDDRSEHRLYSLNRTPQSYLAQYFDIDPVKIEREKRAMLDLIRANNEKDPS